MLRRLVLGCSFLVLFVLSVRVDAQPQEEHQTDYSGDCLADWDPFCPLRPAQYGYAYNTGCYECDYIPEGPDGEPSYYICSASGGVGNPSRCTNYDWGCEMGGLCQLA